jgi:hypothetical protein
MDSLVVPLKCARLELRMQYVCYTLLSLATSCVVGSMVWVTFAPVSVMCVLMQVA